MNKSILGIGTVAGGSFGLVEIKAIGNRAYKWFFEDNFVQDDSAPKDIIEIEATDFDEQHKAPECGYNYPHSGVYFCVYREHTKLAHKCRQPLKSTGHICFYNYK